MKIRLIIIFLVVIISCKKQIEIADKQAFISEQPAKLFGMPTDNLSYDIIVSTVAGTYPPDLNQLDGYAKFAEFWDPDGVVTDANNNLIFADMPNHAIRKFTLSGVLSTIAGNGTWGYNDGSGQTVRLNNPAGLAKYPNGDIIIADIDNNMIRKLTPLGVVSTVAGSTTHGFQDGNSSSALFWLPTDVVIDPSTNDIIVCDQGNNAIRRISQLGIVTTIASGFDKPNKIAIDVNGNIFVTDNYSNKIKKIDLSKNVITIAGGTANWGYLDGPISTAEFRTPYGIVVDAQQNLIISDLGNNAIRKIDFNNNTVSTIAGGNGQGYLDGPASSAQFSRPGVLAFDNFNDLIILEFARIRKLSSGVVSTITGNGNFDYGFQDGVNSGSLASFYYPSDVACDVNNNLIVADDHLRNISYSGIVSTLPQLTSNFHNWGVTNGFNGDRIVTRQTCVYKVSSTGIVSLIAGSLNSSGYLDGNGGNARFTDIRGVVFDASGNIYVADYGNYVIRKIDPSNNVTTFAGLAGSQGNQDGTMSQARFYFPWGLDIDINQNIYVADGNRIRKISRAGVVSTVHISSEGIFDIVNDGNEYIVFTSWHSSGGFTVQKLNIVNGLASTIAGSTSSSGYLDGPGNIAKFQNIYGITIDKHDNIIVADPFNGVIRKISGHWKKF